MKAVKISILALAFIVPLAGCGGKAKSKVSLEDAKPGRDQELFRSAVKAIDKSRYDEGRILLNTLINTYPESNLVQVAKLTIGDSFYLEGGSKNLAQAEVEYRDWVQFFPDHHLADDVMLKMAEIHMRQVMAPDRDPTHAKLAERQLQELLRRHPNTDQKESVEGRITEIQEYLAMHELKVARFYYTIRSAALATQLRTEEILNKYPNFSRFDEALFLHARAMADQEDTETAAQDLTRLVRNYPHSEYREKAEAMLKNWQKPVPEPDPAKVAAALPEGKGFVPRFFGFVFGTKVSNISTKGVVVDKDLKSDEIVARAQQLAGATPVAGAVTPGAGTTTNAADSRPRTVTRAGQDVEVKPASNSKDSKKNSEKEKDSKDPKKKNDPKVLRNP
ncbi:MAG TPA: outer membrane protein assembly factor BamD [Blastocatellia bacterium]|nr:outer membrane protein assembly factor BamD [Blastocatellia bacterium]